MAASEDVGDENSENSSLCSCDSGGHVGLHLQAVQMFQEFAYPAQETLKALVQKTELHVELPDDLLQATFELMKRVVLAPPCCRLTPGWSLSELCNGDASEPTVDDFKRAYALVHDWFPEHPTEPGCAARWMWYESRAEMLQALLQLAKMEVLPGQDSCTDFAEWVEEEIKSAQPQGQEESRYRKRRSNSRDWGRVVQNDVQDLQPESREEEARPLTSLRSRTLEGVVPSAHGAGELRDVAHHNLLAMHALLCQSATRVHLSWWQKVFKSMHIIYIILMMNTFAIFEAGCIGLIVQFFLDINIVHVSDFVFTEWRMVVMAPVFLTFGAFLGHEIFELAGDTINRPPFQKCRAHMMVTLEILVHGKGKMLQLSLWSVKGLDFLFTWALVLPCLVGAMSVDWAQDVLEVLGLNGKASEMQSIRDRGWMNSQMHVTAIAGLCWCVFIWITFMFCKLFNYFTSYSRMTFFSDGEHSFPVLAVVRVIQDNLVCYNIFPGFCERYFVTIKRHMAAAHGSDHLTWTLGKISLWVERWDDWKVYSDHIARVEPGLHLSRVRRGLELGLAGLVLWPFLYFACIWALLGALRALHVLSTHWLHVASVWSCGLLINAAAHCLATATYRFLPRLNSSAFRGHMLLFQVLNLIMMVLSTGHNKFLEGTPDLVMHANSTDSAFYNSPDMDGMGHTITPYPVCSMRWGRKVVRGFEDGRLSALDLGVLSSYAYAANRTLFTSLVKSSFGSNVEVLEVSKFSAIPRTVMVRFPAREHMAGTIVVAVKGTSTMEEAFADMGLYTNMAMLQLLDKVLPILHTFPVSVIAAAIGHLTVPFSSGMAHDFLEELKQSVKDIRKAHPNHSIVLTGHSLGGGLAEVAAAQLSVPGLVFSAPGNLFVTKELDVPKKDVYRNIVGIMPDDDFVPRVDEHVDMVQRIECRDKYGVPRDSFTCHRILVSICELWRVCGDVQRRDFAPTCVGEGLVRQACESRSECF